MEIHRLRFSSSRFSAPVSEIHEKSALCFCSRGEMCKETSLARHSPERNSETQIEADYAKRRGWA
jgi:hypothetical protein